MKNVDVFVCGHLVVVSNLKPFIQKPLGRNADSDDDCYGYSELEYNIISVFDDEENPLSKEDSDKFCDENSENINDAIWSYLER